MSEPGQPEAGSPSAKEYVDTLVKLYIDNRSGARHIEAVRNSTTNLLWIVMVAWATLVLASFRDDIWQPARPILLLGMIFLVLMTFLPNISYYNRYILVMRFNNSLRGRIDRQFLDGSFEPIKDISYSVEEDHYKNRWLKLSRYFDLGRLWIIVPLCLAGLVMLGLVSAWLSPIGGH